MNNHQGNLLPLDLQCLTKQSHLKNLHRFQAMFPQQLYNPRELKSHNCYQM